MRTPATLLAGAALLLSRDLLAEHYTVTLPCTPLVAEFALSAARIALVCPEGSGVVGHIVDLPTGRLLLTTRFEQLPGPAVAGSLLADGSKWAVIAANGTSVVYQIGATPRRWSTGTAGERMGFLSSALLAGVSLWDVRGEPKSLGTVGLEFGGITGTALTADGSVTALAGEDTTIRLYDTKTLQLLRTIAGLTTPTSLAFSPNGKQLFVAGGMGRCITAYDTLNGAQLHSWKDQGQPVVIQPTANGRSLAVLSIPFAAAPGSGMESPRLELLDLDSGSFTVPRPGVPVDALALVGGEIWAYRRDGDQIEAWTL